MDDPRRIAVSKLVKKLTVPPHTSVSLPRDFSTRYKPSSVKKKNSQALLAEGISLLAEYQARLYADARTSVLLVLQAIDAAGKDGTIKHVMSGVNPQGVNVHSFKTPTHAELDHDFLWRCAVALPARGMIGIFNRSYYEEVVVVRVHPEFLQAQELPPTATQPPAIWAERYQAINNWEKYLTEQGTRIVKIFLNVSKDEQARRFLSRIDDPAKNWKFSGSDMAEREYWDHYQHAYSEMLSNTSTSYAPWHVVPADRKWFARLATAAILIDTLMEIDPQYPSVDKEIKSKLGEYRKILVNELADHAK